MVKSLSTKDKRYRRKIADMPCEGCAIEDDTRVTHHFTFTKSAGMSQQAPEWEGVCLCYICHSNLHNGGERSFWHKLGRDLDELIIYARELYERYY